MRSTTNEVDLTLSDVERLMNHDIKRSRKSARSEFLSFALKIHGCLHRLLFLILICCCLTGMHQCKTDQCISPLQVCNGQNDCMSGHDELRCSAIHCNSYQFECSNRRCIYKSRVCDGVNDCQDSPVGSDEQNCMKRACTEGHRRCNNTGRCIPKDWLCDGDNDCGDKSDEAENFCPKTCSTGFFRCKIKYQCIPQNKTCDGVFDCEDRSDEAKIMCPGECWSLVIHRHFVLKNLSEKSIGCTILTFS